MLDSRSMEQKKGSIGSLGSKNRFDHHDYRRDHWIKGLFDGLRFPMESRSIFQSHFLISEPPEILSDQIARAETQKKNKLAILS